MNETKATVKSTFELDIFGQNPRLSRLYTQLCFAFSLPDTGGQSQQNVVEHLRQGLRRLSISLPWLAGNVVKDSTGVFKIETSGELPQLIVKDARHELPPFEEYRRAKFPFSMLDEKLIASCNTMPTQDSQDAPVLSLQLTLVEGGVLLVFSGQHNCMDMRGQSVLMSLVGKACRDESISDEELVNLRGDYSVPIADLEDANATPEPSQAAKSTHRPSQDVSDAGTSLWAYFNFSSTALSTLKATAESSITTEFVSTDDVLSAFIWQSVTRARLYRLNAAIDQSTFERQVDVRKHLGLSIDYIGNAVHKTSNQETMVQLLEQPLGVIASHLRESLSPDQDLGHKARVAAARLSLSLKNPMHNPAQARTTLPSTVIKMSSWAKEQCSTFDFGRPLGIAEAVRRPAFQAWEGLAYMMPKALNGDIAVALCLRNTDMDRLRCDEVFMQLGQYIG